jgi:[ribosomal protein S18]-alanine N-acetyltransferase
MSMMLPADEETILIRVMEADDLEQVYAIDQMSFSMPWPASAYQYELYDNPRSLLWVAEATAPNRTPHIVGMIVVWLIMDEAHIATIAVHPDYRGQGIARHILRVALEGSIQHGSRSATLEVRAHNIAAQQLYRRFRFEVVGNRPRYYRDNNEDAWIMTVEGLGEDYLAWLRSGAWKDGKPGRWEIKR